MYEGRKAFVREWRADRLLTQTELAKKAGVTRETVVSAEAGQPIRLATVRKLAAALGIEEAALFRAPQEGS